MPMNRMQFQPELSVRELLSPRVRQLRAQVIDLYGVARQTLHYNRVSWVVRVGLPTVRALRMAACSLSMLERPAAGALPLSVTR